MFEFQTKIRVGVFDISDDADDKLFESLYNDRLCFFLENYIVTELKIAEVTDVRF